MTQGLTGLEPVLILVIDAASSTTYFGKATPGTSTASGTWQIQRMTDVAGILSFEWADGNKNFDNIWDNRTGTSYS